MRTRALAAVTLLVSLTAHDASAQKEETRDPISAAGLDAESGGGPSTIGRLRVSDLSVMEEQTDFVIRTGVGNLPISRKFNSNSHTWSSVFEAPQWFGVAKVSSTDLFGQAHWLASLASYGFETRQYAGDPILEVKIRDVSGDLLTFPVPQDLALSWQFEQAETEALDGQRGTRLIRISPSRYVLVKPGAGRYVYEQYWSKIPSQINQITPLRLVSVYPPEGSTPICDLQYGANRGRVLGLSCFGGQYVNVIWENDRVTRLQLSRPADTTPPTPIDVVRYGYDGSAHLQSVEREPVLQGTAPATYYSYGDWGPGWGSQIHLFASFQGVAQGYPTNITQEVEERVDGPGRYQCGTSLPLTSPTYSFYNGTFEWTGRDSSSFSMPDDADCTIATSVSTKQTPSSEILTSSYRSYKVGSVAGRTFEASISCAKGGAPCASMSSATSKWIPHDGPQWQGQSNPLRQVDRYYRDFRGAFTTTTARRVCTKTADCSGPPSPETDGLVSVEVLTRSSGAVDEFGRGALKTEAFTWQYSPQAFEKLPATKSEPSVLQPGQSSVTTFSYDVATRRLKATYRTGWSRDYRGNAIPRTVATFYFDYHKCGGGPTDPQGRTLEVHGPCGVSSTNAVDCGQASETIPIKRMRYYDPLLTGPNAGRLQSTEVAVNATASNSSCSGVTWLRTGYGYDLQGNVIEETDPNGVVTYRSYSAGRLTQETVGGATTKYFYHPSQGGQLSAKRRPSGVWEKYCYRQSLGDTSCRTGVLTPVLQWSARVDWSDPNNEPETAPILEQTKFGYATGAGALSPSGGVVSYEDSQSFVSALERVVATYAYDALGRKVAARSVNTTTGAENFKSPSLFDENGNVLGAGAPYNAPPELCGGQVADPATSPYKNAASSSCTRSQYDRLNRLSKVTSPSGVVTEFTYDAQGNIRTVAQTPGGTLASYEYDDFGNATLIALQGAAPLRQEFDARGNIITKHELAKIGNRSEKVMLFGYDGAGRPTYAVTPDQVLVRLGYDEATVPWPNCPLGARTRGRIQWKDDSLGRSWYEYNELGAVTKVRRVRAGGTACGQLPEGSDATPDTLYEYLPDGRLEKMRYPHGRWVFYTYGFAGHADEVVRLDTGLRADGLDRVPVVTNVRYGLGGALLGYDTGSTPIASVDWIRGASYDSANNSCAALDTSRPGSSDGTGRLWGLWVSRQGVNVMKRQYGWAADQLAREGTCLLDSANLSWQHYQYDADLQLTVHSTTNGTGVSNYSYVNGSDRARVDEESLDSWVYGYDSNRRLKTIELAAEDGATWSRRDFVYNQGVPSGGGRAFTTNQLSSLTEAMLPPSAGGALQSGTKSTFQTHDGLWGVYSSVNVNGALYQYIYDAVGRRRLKVYPTGTTDEFFYDQDQLIEDRGRRSPRQAAPPDPLTGTWQFGPFSMNLSLTGSALSGTLDDPDHTQTFAGTYNATTQRSTLYVYRTHRHDKCMTVMYGEIRVLSQTQLGVEIFGTDGACDLELDYFENNVYTRPSAPPQGNPDANLAGAWLRSGDNISISLSVSGSRATGRLDTADFRHTLSGTVNPTTGVASLTVTRVNMHSGCATNMYGTMSASDTQLQVSITGTDGLCDLPTWYSENSTYQRTEAAAEYVLHEYIWLGGRPVAVVKTALDASYNRMTAKNCWRNDEYDACGTVYPVSDYLPKVVAVLDGAGRLAGAADYDAFGRVNEVNKRADVPAPRPGPATAAYPTGRYPFGAYTPNQNVDLAVLSQPWGSSSQRVQMRVNYAQVNTPGGMASSTDKTWVTLGSGAQVAPTPTPEDRWYAGRLYATRTNWFEAPANGDVRVRWVSGPTQQAQEYTGATVRSYEYRRFELGAQPTWVALRFPGQYADAETGLYENWNRFYDPGTGRYTASDPLALRPAWFRKEAQRAGQCPVFPYATNSPTGRTDPHGRMAKFVATLVRMTARGIAATRRLKNKRQAAEAVARGLNVAVEGTKNAKTVAAEAGKLRGGDGAATKAESHALRDADGNLTGQRGADHFHALDRNGDRIEAMGHTFTVKDVSTLGVAFVVGALDSNGNGEVDLEDTSELANDILTPLPGMPTIAEQRQALFPTVDPNQLY